MSEWKEYSIVDFAEVLNQNRIPLSSMERASKKGKYPYYGASGIIDYLDDFIFEGEHVLVSEDGENLKSRNTPIAFKASGQFWVNNHAHILKGKKDFHNQLIVYYLQNLDLNPYLTGAVQPKLNKAALTSIPFFLPTDESEQRTIASVLTSLDNKIDLLHRQNQTLEKIAETLFRQWFVEEAKEDWSIVAVGDFVKTNQKTISRNYSFTEIKYLDTSSLNRGLIGELQVLNLKEAPSRAKRLVLHNDVLISTVRPDQQHYGIIKNPEKNLVVSTGFCVITCDKIDPHFIYLLLTNNEMTDYLHSIAEGSTSTYPSLKPSDIEKIKFQLPPNEKLNEFKKIATSSWDKINQNHTQIRTLTALRDILLPKLMSGEVRVEK